MMEVHVKHEGAVKFSIAARENTIISDQPPSNGGADEGMTPPELFLASIGSCAAFYAVAYLKKKGLEREGVEVHVTSEKAMGPARLDQIKIAVDVPGTLSEEDRAGVQDSVGRCLIHNTLTHPPEIQIELRTPVTA